MSWGFVIGFPLGVAAFGVLAIAGHELVYRLRGRPWPSNAGWPMRISNLWTKRTYDVWTKKWSDD